MSAWPNSLSPQQCSLPGRDGVREGSGNGEGEGLEVGFLAGWGELDEDDVPLITQEWYMPDDMSIMFLVKFSVKSG